MFVCIECHERDRLSIKCVKKSEAHLAKMFGQCDICGRPRRDLVYCMEYPFQTFLSKVLKIKEKQDVRKRA